METLIKVFPRLKQLFFVLSVSVVLNTSSLFPGVGLKAANMPNNSAGLKERSLNDPVEQMISRMTDKEKIGQLVMPSVRYHNNSVPDEFTRRLIKEYGIGSVIHYGNSDAETTAKFNNHLQQWASETRLTIPLLISADMEFGTAQLVTDGTAFPRQMAIAAARDPAAAELAARITAVEMKGMGFNWNYSPVADVNTNPRNPVIGIRSFGEKTDLVSQMTAAQIKAYQNDGILATAKHFPGHGDTSVDSHLGLAAVTYDRKTLEEVHLPPFKAAISAGVESIMTAHVIINALDPGLPATLSKKVLTDLLRNRLGFKGIIVTDSMSMNAIDHHWGVGQAAVMAVKAGADIVMATGTFKHKLETYEALYAAVKSGELPEERVNASLRRILKTKMKYDLFHHRFVDPSKAKIIVHSPGHKNAAAEIAEKSITLLKNDGILPFQPKSSESTLIVGPKIGRSTKFIEALTKTVKSRVSGKVTSIITDFNSTDAEISRAAALARQSGRIIVATYSAGTLPAGQEKLVRTLQLAGKPLVAVSLGLPYDIKNYPQAGAYIASYALDRWGSPVPASLDAAVAAMFGSRPEGKLPVTIRGMYPYGFHLGY